MKRNLKALGLSMVAVFAMSAMVAQGAMAEPLFKSTASHTTISGGQEGKHVFEAGEGNKVECSTATFKGTQSGTSSDKLTITPTYSGCTAFGFANTHVNFTGQDYLFTSTNDEVHLSGTIDLTPTIFGFSVCTVTVSGGSYSGVTYENVAGSPDKVKVIANVGGISYSEDGSGCGVGSGNDGTYKGNTTVEGKNTSNEGVDIEVG